MGTHYNRLGEVILMSTRNICFYGESMKNYPSKFNYYQITSLSVLLCKQYHKCVANRMWEMVQWTYMVSIPPHQLEPAFSLDYLGRIKRIWYLSHTYVSSEGSGEPAHPRSLARTSAARSYKQWVKRNLQTENQILGPSEWQGMRS